MTLSSLLIGIAIAALVLTAIVHFVFKKVTSWPISLLQNFCGALFIFSGYVKAVDPLGTAYKMEQYFGEFESTFAGSAFSFLAPLFPWLGGFAVTFAVFMIVLEIVLGFLLIIGLWRKFSAWVFFLTVAFFTVLTGFTYLTGYVPEGVNFFQFSGWGEYVKTNMKVTDCGCFGDFIVLEPKTSFLKDVFLLVPSLLFLFFHSKMHQIFTPTVRMISAAASVLLVTLFCFANYKWDIPSQDFRPFKVGVDIAARKLAEEEASSSIQVLGYDIKNRVTGEQITLSLDEYLQQYQNFSDADFKIEQRTTEPTIKPTKISEFELTDRRGYDAVPEMLEDEGFTFFVVAYQIKGKQTGTTTVTLTDRIMKLDTLLDDKGRIQQIDTNYLNVDRQVEKPVFSFDPAYKAQWLERVHPVLVAAQEKGHKVIAATKLNDRAILDAFREEIGATYDFVLGDDILLKTIIRSNPGVLLLKKGVILNKWHHRKLPDYSSLSATYGL